MTTIRQNAFNPVGGFARAQPPQDPMQLLVQFLQMFLCPQQQGAEGHGATNAAPQLGPAGTNAAPQLGDPEDLAAKAGLPEGPQQQLARLLELLRCLCGDAASTATPAAPKKLEGKVGGKWLAEHGGYEKQGDGSYKITKGEYQGHTAVHQGEGKFMVKDAQGQAVGQYEAPTKTEKIASPLTFDLNGDGKVSTTGIGKKFDIDGDGKVDLSAWAGKGDGVLAFGDAASGRSLLGNNSDIDGDGKADGYANGFEALGALAKKHLGEHAVADGRLDAKELAELEKKAGLTMLVDGRRRGLAEAGVQAVELGYREAGRNPDAHGNEHRQVGRFTRNDGTAGKVNDVWFRYE